MKNLIILISLFLNVTVMSQMAQANPEKITIGFIPSSSPQEVKSQSLVLAQALQDELKIPVQVYISKNYSGLVDALKSKKVDFAFLSSMTYAQADASVAAKVLLKKVYEEPFYYSAIVVNKKSNIHKLSDLKNKKMAFVDEKSASGYLYPTVELQKQKIQLKVSLFSGNHKSSVEMLEKGEVDAIAVFADDPGGKSSAWQKFATNKNNFKILWMSTPIPNDPFCVHNEFYEKNTKLTHQLMMSLIEISERDSLRKQMGDLIGRKGLMLATQKQYDSVREVVQKLQLKVIE